MESALSPIEVRVLACLIEKAIATPEYYPLTLNALVAACNQKSKRDGTGAGFVAGSQARLVGDAGGEPHPQVSP